ncbi:MAG: hypothetical protein GX492_11430 [Firmicutes bacterium]|nr:hypothetical protein [Bacillota bacterium]
MPHETNGSHVGGGEPRTRLLFAAKGAVGAVRDDDVGYKPWTSGIVWDGETLVFVTYGPEEFRVLWGGGVDEYNDFLVRRRQVIAYHRGSWSPSRMVPIPFDMEDFERWLSENPSGRTCGDRHREWALSVFMDAGKLALLRARHPLSYCVPEYETLEVRVYAWSIAVTVRDRDSMKRMGRRLPLTLIERYGKELISRSLCRLPLFERLSSCRVRGAGVILADRFVAPERTSTLGERLRRRALRAFRAGEIPQTLAVSRRWRPRSQAHRSYPCVQVVCWPVVIIGSATDVETVASVVGSARGLLHVTWFPYLARLGAKIHPDGMCLLHPFDRADIHASLCANGLAPETDFFEPDPPHLRRIK